MPSVTFIIHSPAPYHVELFDALTAEGSIDLSVLYLHSREQGRQWSQPALEHRAHFFDRQGSDAQEAFDADLVVIGFANHPLSRRLMAERTRLQRRWAFWGERPGAHSRGLTGKLMRRWRLRSLRRSSAPIWGIGQWAVDSYKREIGGEREFRNLPYFSDLLRFQNDDLTTEASNRSGLRFLFVGGLSERKGADLVLAAFRQLHAEEPEVGHTLTFTGDGPLKESLQKDAAPLGDRCQFAGFADWSQLPGAYRQHDCLVVPSRYDGWGMVVPEGLAAGLPVIASDCMGSALDLIRPTLNGWHAASGSLASLHARMTQAAKNIPLDRAAWRSCARHSVTHHQLEDGVTAFLSAIEAALTT
ncbi:MAG: glycosyltransferase family 4 protein [Verrucomicrobiaceae bacterium]|nr:glycosyltransferase family 4 protein [Verrucomicrobiaceae bacterium]